MDNGAIANAFAVTDLDRDKNLFNRYTSLYRTKPDPSFVLPYKFVVGDSNPSMPKFIVNPSRAEAMTMRGVRFLAKDYNKYTSKNLIAGLNYQVQIPLYNASFKDANNVRVNLYWLKNNVQEEGLDEKVFIGRSPAVNMSGWSDDGKNEANNKAWVYIDFTPNKTITKDGNYYLYAEIEYSGDEVHKNRSAEDPGGNNQGYFAFSVEGSDTAEAAGFRASTTLSEDIEYLLSIVSFPKVRYNDKEGWADFFNAYVKDSEGPFTMKVAITNEMDYTIPSVEFCSFFYDKDLWEGEHIPYTTTSYSEHMTLFPHETYSFEVTVDAETADRMRAAGLGNVWCDLKYRPALLDAIYEAVYGHPYSGNIPDGDAAPAADEEDEGETPPEDEAPEGTDNSLSDPGSSSSGCNAGISVSVLGLMSASLLLRRRTH